MAIWLDGDFNSEMLDTANGGVINENFTYLVKQLMDFVDPQYTYASVNKPFLKGGKRRAVRADRSTNLGYQYKSAASKSKVSSRGTKKINAFGTDILVEEWTVSHPTATDSDLGEIYPGQDSKGSRGPYTCLMTARISLSKKTPTRCYVQCNCKDFQTTFYEKLNKAGYTNPQSIPASTGKKALAPAICKHLYAIYSQFYRDLINDVEGLVVDENPVLFGAPGAPAMAAPPTLAIPSTKPKVAITKQDAVDLIMTRLKQEHTRLKNNEYAYLDSRSKSSGGGRHHLYPFSVVLLNGQLRAIAYRNKDSADPKFKNNAQIQLLHIPDNPKIWQFLNKQSDHTKLWDMIRSLGEMPESMNNAIRKRVGVGVYMENSDTQITELSYLIEPGNSTILSSISELS